MLALRTVWLILLLIKLADFIGKTQCFQADLHIKLKSSRWTRLSNRPAATSKLLSSKNGETKSKVVTPKPKPSKQLERLTNDQGKRLVSWIEENGGLFRGAINHQLEGWKVFPSTSLSYKIPKFTELIRIPKSICLYSNPKDMKKHQYHEYLTNILSSIDESQWRTRLGLILLSERVNPETKFHPYIMNLPFEIWGIPIFFDFYEIRYLQDEKLKLDTRYRCKFLSEFAEKLFPPIYKSLINSNNNKKNNPFYGRSPDVNSFGWGFSCASSRALERESIIRLSTNNNENNEEDSKSTESSAAVIIPGIDLLSHSFDPNCIVIDDPKTDSYILYNTKDITTTDELTINYGPFSNLDLFANYGFTVYPNPSDRLSFTVNHTTINLARVIMGQTTNFRLFQEMHTASKQDFRRQYRKPLLNSYHIGVGLSQNLYDDNQLQQWQTYWLKALQLYSPIDSKQPLLSTVGANLPGAMTYFDKFYQFLLTTTANPPNNNQSTLSVSSQIDKRLLSLLRILYSKSEDDLLTLGYDPYLLGERGSILPNPLQEAHVIKTLIGMLLYEIRRLETSLNTDLKLLQENLPTYEEDYPTLTYLQQENLQYFQQPLITEKEEFVEIHYDIQICHQIFREILNKLKLKQQQQKQRETEEEQKATAATTSGKKGRKSKKQDAVKATVGSASLSSNEEWLSGFFQKMESMLMERLMLEPLQSSPTKTSRSKAKNILNTSMLEKYRLLDEEKKQPLFLTASSILSDDDLSSAALKALEKTQEGKKIPPVVLKYIQHSQRLLEPIFNQLPSSSSAQSSPSVFDDEFTKLLSTAKLNEEQRDFLNQLMSEDITQYSDMLRQVTSEIELYKFAYMIEKYLLLKQSEATNTKSSLLQEDAKSMVSSGFTGYPVEYYEFIEGMIEGILTQNLTMISEARKSFLDKIYDPSTYLPFDTSSPFTTSASPGSTEGPVTYLTLTAPYDAVLKELGKDLPINIRESYRYRIRRKLFLYDTIEQLVQDYQFLQSIAPQEIGDLEDVFLVYEKRLEKLKADKLKLQKDKSKDREVYFFPSSDAQKTKELVDVIVSDPVLKTSNEISYKWSNLDVDL